MVWAKYIQSLLEGSHAVLMVDNAISPPTSFTKEAHQLRGPKGHRRKRSLPSEQKVKYPKSRWQSDLLMKKPTIAHLGSLNDFASLSMRKPRRSPGVMSMKMPVRQDSFANRSTVPKLRLDSAFAATTSIKRGQSTADMITQVLEDLDLDMDDDDHLEGALPEAPPVPKQCVVA